MNSQWMMFGASVQGRAHMKNEMPCQDYTFSLHRGGVYVCALADGAGSCSHADKGAEIAARTAAYVVSERFGELMEAEHETCVRILLEEIRSSIVRSPDYVEPIKNYSSTLLFVAVHGDRYIAGHLGDGVIGGERAGVSFVLSPPDNGEFHNTTFFTTSEQAEERMRIYRGELGDISGFFLMSDGAAESLYNRKSESLAPALIKVREWADKYAIDVLEQALQNNLEKVIREQTIDDCSLAIMALQRPAEPPSPGEEGGECERAADEAAGDQAARSDRN